ncbi:MAG: septum formation protein Maf [Clostridia bacterium]|nr:septum formation protein Maf [Clostridia bacterium]
MKHFILASASPRRREILAEHGYDFTVIPSNTEETVCDELEPVEYVKLLAKQKAVEVFSRTKQLTLGADTIVVLDGQILGKPANKSINAQFLKNLSGKSHYVYTGFAIVDKDLLIVDVDKTRVEFNSLTDKDIKLYVDSGLGLDKAGGYGIQDGFNLVKEIEGSFYNVVGLPIEKINQTFKELK